MFVSGIYMITNNITGQKYIGMAWDVVGRFATHRSPKVRSKLKVSYDIGKYGLENFKFEILRVLDDFTYNFFGRFYEQYYMAIYNPEYNIAFGYHGGGCSKNQNLDDKDFAIKSRTRWDKELEYFKEHKEELFKECCKYARSHKDTARWYRGRYLTRKRSSKNKTHLPRIVFKTNNSGYMVYQEQKEA